jgi:hypothetical protein
LHKLGAQKPFAARAGPERITMKFQYVGHPKFRQLSQIHGIQFEVNSDPDIFLIDCEGLHSYDQTTPALKQATFALSQLVSMTVLVMKDQVNQSNIEKVRSLLALSHGFSETLPGFEIGTTILMRDVGARCPKGKTLTLAQKNELRQQSDRKQRTHILKALNDAGVRFSEQNLLVLVQPVLMSDGELYRTSIEEFLMFTTKIASTRANISGESLLNLFKRVKPSVMRIPDLSNPSIPIAQVMRKSAIHELTAATASLEQEIRQYMVGLDSSSLRARIDARFVRTKTSKLIRHFQKKAKARFSHVLEYSTKETRKHTVPNIAVGTRVRNEKADVRNYGCRTSPRKRLVPPLKTKGWEGGCRWP